MRDPWAAEQAIRCLLMRANERVGFYQVVVSTHQRVRYDFQTLVECVQGVGGVRVDGGRNSVTLPNGSTVEVIRDDDRNGSCVTEQVYDLDEDNSMSGTLHAGEMVVPATITVGIRTISADQIRAGMIRADQILRTAPQRPPGPTPPPRRQPEPKPEVPAPIIGVYGRRLELD